MLDVCLLGTGGMMPIPGRFLSSMLIRHNGTNLLVDCGEGTQIPMQAAGWGFRNIEAILFTHYHGDHICGLPGILFQMLNAGRTEPLTLIGPKGINFLKHLENVVFNKGFEINYEEIGDNSTLQFGDIFVKNLQVKHNITCNAYSFEVARLPKFEVEKAKALNIPVIYWKKLQNGVSINIDDKTINPKDVLGKQRKGLKVIYSTDTRPTNKLIDFVKEADLYIGEGMYGDDLNKGEEKMHSTFIETATMAKQGNVKELWLTHYSPSLRKPEYFLDSAQNIFKNTILGKDLMEKSLKFES